MPLTSKLIAWMRAQRRARAITRAWSEGVARYREHAGHDWRRLAGQAGLGVGCVCVWGLARDLTRMRSEALKSHRKRILHGILQRQQHPNEDSQNASVTLLPCASLPDVTRERYPRGRICFPMAWLNGGDVKDVQMQIQVIICGHFRHRSSRRSMLASRTDGEP
ncbi:hypothetical protein F5Y15DRAFT_346802 [Xylariaceae sp. FL0016]|nr:hypothetical protein F5Y15DRAFT_346802 [Xylariaceae sp. FL0016]